jgi:hypothetical protein
MKQSSKFHLILALFINLAVMARLINMAWDGNGKGMLLVVFYYLVLILANAILWVRLHIKKHPAFIIYKMTTIGLLLLFIPVLVLASLH